MPIIELQDVSKLYGFGDATTLALDEINLTIDKGEFVAVMGPSGCGKSTLLNLIGLLDRPTHGIYKLEDVPVSKFRQKHHSKIRRDKIGFVFQSFNLLPRLTVLENVALPLAYKGMPLVKRHKQASAMLERVGLREREYYMPRHLSGGQTQRVAIARALITGPSIIIADEPTGNLDSASSRVVMELLSDIHQMGNTVIMVTHNPELTRYASRVVYMQDGSIVHDERSRIGDVPSRARKIIFTMPRKDEDDDLAGVSAVMKAIPGSDTISTKSKSRRTKSKRAKTHKRRKK